MLTVGDVVEAEVADVRVFGIFCRHDSEEMLVVIPETSWIASACSCEQFAQIGDTITVKVLNIDRETGKIAATVKGRHPNPWKTDQLSVGSRYTARVVRYVEKSHRCGGKPAYLVELLPGAFVMLCDTSESLSPGDYVDVAIQSADARRSAISIERVPGS